jgi:NCS1 family nucleobase:cation symporter-1
LADPALQFFSASAVYLVLSKAFPAHETFLAEAILGDDFGLNIPTEESSASSAGDEKEKANVLANHVD